MAIKRIILHNVKYIPRTDDKHVVVAVSVGDAADESSSYNVYRGLDFIARDEDADVGVKAEITGKVTRVSVTIVDLLRESNWTSFTVFIKEGNLPVVSYGPYSEQVDEDGDTINYILKIEHQ